MPYKIYRQGKKHCVRNTETGESKGCSDTHEMAARHMRALYAAKGGAKMGKKESDVIEDVEPIEEEVHEKEYVPYGVFSFADLEAARVAEEAVEEIHDITEDYVGLVNNILYNAEIADKPSAIKALTDEFSACINSPETEDKETCTDCDDKEEGLIARITDRVKELFAPLFKKEEVVEESVGSFMVWKEKDGSMRFIARYSNNIRDDDDPAEIITAKSHERFVQLVDSKEAEPPELWLWHVPEWKLGKSTWVAYDDTGFAVAAGVVDQDKQEIAEYVSQQKGLLMSHGMPISSIKRDPDDESVIVEHITKEVSVLPSWAAANKFTSFVVLNNKEEVDSMSIPQKKVEALVREWGGATQEHLATLEKLNSADTEKAAEEGRETKETEAVAEIKEEETVAAPAAEQSPYATREEIAEAFANVFVSGTEEIKQQIALLAQSVEQLKKEVADLSQDDEEKIKAVVAATPVASLGALIARQMSAVGSKETEVRKNSGLTQSKPKETADSGHGSTGIPFIDEMLAASPRQ